MDVPAYTMRAETAEDVPFLRRLYVAIRWEETTAMGFVDLNQRLAFLNSQFDLQRAHYLHAYDDGDFGIIEQEGIPVGRLYLWRGARDHRIVDISLLPDRTGHGLGGAILDAVQAEAAAAGKSVSIHVEQFNPARRLYDRKGFKEIEAEGPYWLMEWHPDGAIARG